MYSRPSPLNTYLRNMLNYPPVLKAQRAYPSIWLTLVSIGLVRGLVLSQLVPSLESSHANGVQQQLSPGSQCEGVNYPPTT